MFLICPPRKGLWWCWQTERRSELVFWCPEVREWPIHRVQAAIQGSQRRPEHASCKRQSTQLAPKARNSTQERRAGRSPSPRLIHSRISISVSDQTDHSLCHEFQTPRIQDEGKQRHPLGCEFAPCSPPTLSSRLVECTTLPRALCASSSFLAFVHGSSFLLKLTHSPLPLYPA